MTSMWTANVSDFQEPEPRVHWLRIIVTYVIFAAVFGIVSEFAGCDPQDEPVTAGTLIAALVGGLIAGGATFAAMVGGAELVRQWRTEQES
jgi:hypothetical protein